MRVYQLKKTKGDTPCETTNEAHRELVDLKAKNLLPIAQIIFKNINRKHHLRQYSDTDIEKLIRVHVDNDNITKKDINKSMKKELGIIPKCPICHH